MVIGYARVSTGQQDAKRQRLDIYDYATANGLSITNFITEIVSSRKKDRAIYDVINSMEKDDVLIVTEISRLARSMIELNKIVGKVLESGGNIRAVVGGHVIDDSIVSQTLVFAFGIASQIERDMISERTKSALHARKEAGIKLGRPVGSSDKVDKAIADNRYKLEDIVKFRKANVTVKALAKMIGVDARTMKKWLDTHSC